MARALPGKLLRDPAIDFEAFIARVNSFLYDGSSPIPKSGTLDYQFVYDQAVGALSLQKSAAFIRLQVFCRNKTPPYGPYGFEGGKVFEFSIDSSFWLSEHADFSRFIRAGRLIVPREFLEIPEALVKNIESFECGSVPIRIRSPLSLISSWYGLASLPDEEWMKKYRKYRIELVRELIAVCWRYIAIRKLEYERETGAKLFKVMHDYMEVHGHDRARPQEPTLRQISWRIARQLEAQDLNSSVLISTNPQEPIH